MTAQDRLELLKIDLGISATAYDERLKKLLVSAQSMIKREGITIDEESAEDDELIVMYAAYLWRQRKGEATGMPRMLRYALNNRLFSEKAGGDNNG